MFFNTKQLSYYYIIVKNQKGPFWLLLHGFMGSHNDFLTIAKQLPGTVIIPDLLGHGQSSYSGTLADFSIEHQADDLVELITSITFQKVNVLGYSMGGRLALSLALRHPQIVQKLFLESSTAGIADNHEREARLLNDQKLARRLQEDSLKNFVNFWENLSLFSSQKKLPIHLQSFVRSQRLKQSNQGLVNSLLGMGTGTMPNYWDNLKTLNTETILFAGELDPKFKKITTQMQHLLPHSDHFIVNNAGHNIHLEQPKQFTKLILKRG